MVKFNEIFYCQLLLYKWFLIHVQVNKKGFKQFAIYVQIFSQFDTQYSVSQKIEACIFGWWDKTENLI